MAHLLYISFILLSAIFLLFINITARSGKERRMQKRKNQRKNKRLKKGGKRKKRKSKRKRKRREKKEINATRKVYKYNEMVYKLAFM